MKKRNNSEKKFIKSQYYELILFNLIAFFTIFVLLGVLATTLINQTFFRDIKNDMLETEEIVKNNIQYSAETDRLIIRGSNNARMLMIFYTDDGQFRYYTNSFLAYLIEDYDKYANINDSFGYPGWDVNEELWNEYILKVQEAESNDIFQIDFNSLDKFEEFATVTTGDQEYTFLTLSFEMQNLDVPLVRYVKILVMVNGEINSRDEIIKIYIASAIMMIIAGAFASIILSMNSIKPIVESLNKQMTFVSDASHELRTPLSIIQSKLENTLTKSEQTVYDVSEDIAVSLKEISRLSKLTTDLLQLAKSDGNREVMNYEVTDIKELIQETSSIFKELAEIQKKEFILNLENVQANVDHNKIVQLLVIILDNALRYTNEGDSITISLTTNNSEFTIDIADTGIGISEETKKKMFERFYREDKARSRETGGNGLGLAIAKVIVKDHFGKIFVNHNEPKGTKFTIIIPKKQKVI
ncbi:MAG: HAMP domain-containing sensor histidine kinase [Bacilli bacterium]|nr:HAMP domain-containing sensor histidine kinase [Bacilli bacterium]